jgi:GAF domain-containing protein
MTDSTALDSVADNDRDQTTTSLATPAYAELAKIVLGTKPLPIVLRRIAELAQEVIHGADEVSVTLIEAGRPRTVAFSGQLAATLDERQYSSGHGPCMDAAVTGQTIAIDDIAHDTVYPEFSRRANKHGIHHALAVGMPSLHGTTGAINIYGSGATGPFEQAARDAAAGFAGYAAVALANAALYAGALDQVAQMKETMTSRAVIEQAKGVIMGERRCSADDAFDILRELSMHSNQTLRDTARSITAATV